MNCPHCGADVVPGYTFCQSCRKRVVAPGMAPPPPPPPNPYGSPAPAGFAGAPAAPVVNPAAALARPGAITLLAIVDILNGLVVLLLAAIFMVAMFSAPADGRLMLFLLMSVLGVVGLAFAGTGVGLLQLRPLARTGQVVLSCLSLLSIPCGTVVGVLNLIYLLKPGTAILFAARDPHSLTPVELGQLEDSRRSSVLVIVSSCLMLLSFLFLPVLAAIAIPSLLRARVSANEAAAVRDMRSMTSAQAAYASANGGYYDMVECLHKPQGCLPSYPPEAPTFLDERFANPTRSGYTFTFHPGAPADNVDPRLGSRTSLRSFAYTAVPTQTNRSGVRSFCVSEAGLVCSWVGYGAPAIMDAQCPVDCTPVM